MSSIGPSWTFSFLGNGGVHGSSLLRPLAGNFLIGEARFTPCRGELSGGAEMLVVDGKTQNEKWPRTKFPSHPRMDRIRDIHTASLNAKPFQGAG